MSEHPVRKIVERLYGGSSRRARLFRYGLIVFDASTIIFFILTTPLDPTTVFLLTCLKISKGAFDLPVAPALAREESCILQGFAQVPPLAPLHAYPQDRLRPRGGLLLDQACGA